jgi:curved DNA-binding protein CbpA
MDHYQILGVSRTASAAEVRKAYVQLAKERHPDRFSDPRQREEAQEFFKQLTTAFNTLSNDRTRREYDAELERPRPTSPEEMAKEAYDRGMAAFQARNPDAAVELLRAAAHYAPGEPRYQMALGRLLARSPRTAREAVACFEKAVEASPRSARLHAELSLLLLGQGLKIRARKAIDTALGLDPDDAEVRSAAAEIELGDAEAGGGEGGGLRGLFRRKT